ncbi:MULTISPECIES: sigma-70 family RNA polymerase sigma factor [Methylobacterium]|jgi:RNA polymerase sigma factor (sigma-70 family)|uniref:RNA polymerase sigma factor n=3 Tax=Methylobacterium TaxID=407 RepID=A0AAE8HS08_9HYPH|nr:MULTISPECIES: sigma-70 family RNA polymerase sigma factor [Methylobacterium]KOX43646.1 RNA polymerase subunit sigma-70 [Streptomyces purpurogeneiscleroticus]AIQ88872.1 RNA polymerase sigma factor [Methylobacterium oryzae CBMB20]APT29789.1 putative RNA polymerase sigma-C factor [Methylobacterium phyllosphaerae]AWV18560.1 RNA polymerase subunit sigma-70 [Methylobacterium sp. XJLW]MBA9062594.1 RNA polymerase sigma factor (sigma-70 family) [Methylobacterium fujisawaense]
MTDAAADLPDAVVRARDDSYAAAIGQHLVLPIREYFRVVEQEPLPAQLAALVTRFEVAIKAHGDTVPFDFRGDIIKALPALRTFALSLVGDVSRADDLVQETFVKAWANQQKFRPGTNFTAWLFTILRNQFYTDLRKTRREVEDVDGTHAGQMSSPSDQEDASTLKVVWERLGDLPSAQRQALLLVGAEGHTYEEAALKLGCQVGTVKSRVSRARSSLLDTLGVVVSGQAPAV